MHIERDESGGFRIRCFAGHTVQGQPTPTRFKAAFPAAACAGCPFAESCPAQALARGGRSYYFTEETVLRQARHRRLQELPEERRTLRANVEATMRQFNAPLRNGKLRTRGLHAAGRYGFLRAVGINFGRIYRHRRRIASIPRKTAVSGPASTLIPLFATRVWEMLRRLCRRLRSFTRLWSPDQYSAAAFA
jgi:hypothetical protein